MIKLGRLSPPRSKLCRFKIRSGPSGFGLFFYPLNPVSSSFHFRSNFSSFSSRSFCFPVSSSFHFRSSFSFFSSRSFCFPVLSSFHFRSSFSSFSFRSFCFPVSSSFHFCASFSSFSFRSFCFPVSLSFHFRSSSSSFSSRSFCFPVSLSFHFRFTLPPSPNRLCSFVVSLSSYFLFVELLSSFFFSRFSIKSIQGLGFVWRLVLLRVFRSLLIGFYEYLVVCFSPIAFLAKDIPGRCGIDFKLYCRTPLVVIA